MLDTAGPLGNTTSFDHELWTGGRPYNPTTQLLLILLLLLRGRRHTKILLPKTTTFNLIVATEVETQLAHHGPQKFQFLTFITPQSPTRHTCTTPSNTQKVVCLLSLHVGLEGSKRVVHNLASVPRDAALATQAFSHTSWIASQDLRDKVGHIDRVRTRVNAKVTIYTFDRLCINITTG